MRQLPQPLPAATGEAHSLHGHLYGVHHGLGWHDEASDDDVVHAPGVIVQGLLAGIQGEPEIAISQVLGVGKTSAEDVRHDGRLDKQMLHFSSPLDSRGCLSAQGQAGAFRGAPTRAVSRLFSLRFAYGSRTVNDCNERVKYSRPAFISGASYARGINSDLCATTNDAAGLMS